MNEWDFYRADELMSKLKKFVEQHPDNKEIEEAVFKLRIDWMFLERRIKTFQRTLPQLRPIAEFVRPRENETPEKFRIRKERFEEVLSKIPDKDKFEWANKTTKEKRKLIDEADRSLGKWQ